MFGFITNKDKRTNELLLAKEEFAIQNKEKDNSSLKRLSFDLHLSQA